MKKTPLMLTSLELLAAGVTVLRADDTSSFTNAVAKPYLLNYCIVSGDKFDGDMDQPVTNYYKGQQIIFCCKDCIKDFKKDPDKYIKKLNEAVKAGAKDKKVNWLNNFICATMKRLQEAHFPGSTAKCTNGKVMCHFGSFCRPD